MAFIPNEGDAPLNGEQAELDSVDVTIILDGTRLRGVKSGCAVTPSSPAAMTAEVAAGVISFGDGTDISVAGGQVSFAAAGTTPRFDLVVASAAGALSVIDGTAFWSATYGPTLPTYADKVVLAAVYIPANATTIETTSINSDKRVALALPLHNNLGGLTTGDPHTQYIAKATMTTTGDLLYASAANTPARLGVGAAAQVLGITAGVPAWQAQSYIDHGSLGGLSDDDHTQYTRKDTLTSTGDLYYASAASTPARLGISIPAANVRNVLGLDDGDTVPAWKTALDATAPSTSAVGDAASSGTSLIFAHRDHIHGRESFATPAIVLGTAAATGVAATPIRSDATIIAFDVTVPSTSAAGDAAATGSVAFAARRDHVHGRESFATPAIVHGTAAAAGAATTPIRSDATIVTFDVTVPTTIAAGDAAATGSVAFAARRDHRHGSPSTWPATAHNILDSSFHGDALTGTVVQGDLIVGNSTPAWSRLARGAAGSVLYGDGTDSAWTIDPRIAGYVHIGATTAPSNTTAGDISGIRLHVSATASQAAFSASHGRFAFIGGTMTDTAAGATAFELHQPTITPASNSSSEFRALYFQQLVNPGTGITLSVIQGGYLETRFRQDGAVTETNALVPVAVIIDSASAATVGTITTVRNIKPFLFVRPSGASTMTITTGIGIDFASTWIQSAGLTLTTGKMINISNPGAGTITTLHGIDIEKLTRATTNIEFRNAGKMVHTPTTQTLAAATDTIVNTARIIELSNSTGASLTLTSDPTISTTGAQDGQIITLVNDDASDDIVLRDDSVASSALRLPGAANLTLGPRDSATFYYNAGAGEWYCIASTNL